MVGREGEGQRRRTSPSHPWTPRRAVDEIEAHGEPRGSGGGHRSLDIRRVVGAVEGGEDVRHSGLHTEGRGWNPFSRNVSRYAASTESGLASVVTSAPGQARTSRMPRSKPVSRPREASWGAAAEEHGVDGRHVRSEHAVGEGELALGRVDVRGRRPLGPELAERVGVEVAIAAADPTEGNVDVDGQRTAREMRQRRRRKLPGGRRGSPSGVAAYRHPPTAARLGGCGADRRRRARGPAFVG